MYNLKELTKIIEKEISNLEFSQKPDGLYQPIKYILLIGGKKIRPVLLLMGYNLFCDDIQKAYKQAVAYEVFHNFTLMHDDVMDNSELRRGAKTVHSKWNVNTAILSGDAMLIKAYDMIIDCEKELMPKVFGVFSTVAREVCEGQQFDMNFETRKDVSVNEYLEMIRLKTAVLIASSLKTGAILAKAPEEDINLLYEFGEKIGLAFQLQDDLLDVYGDTKTFGKKTGGDIVARKKTFLMLSALSSNNKKIRERLNLLLYFHKIPNNELIKQVTEIYDELKLKEISQKLINKYFEEAINALKKVSVSEERKTELLNIAKLIMNRDK